MSAGRLSVRFDPRERPYTGVELRPHFLLTELGLKGSAIAAFAGPCRVATEHLVDWEDRLASDRIEAARMIHFIGEFFGARALREGVLIQRLFMAQLGDALRARLAAAGRRESIRRDGDDLFVSVPGPASGSSGERKLTVSIVTASPVSLLLHVGVNIDPAGAPVPAVGLKELGVDPAAFAEDVLRQTAEEWESVDWAVAKVRPVV